MRVFLAVFLSVLGVSDTFGDVKGEILTIVKKAKEFAEDGVTVVQKVYNEHGSKWTQNFKLWNELNSFVKEQIDLANDVKNFIGDPKAAGKKIATDLWNKRLDDRIDYWEDEIIAHENSADRLLDNAYSTSEIFKSIPKTDTKGVEIRRDMDYYKRHAYLEELQEDLHNYIISTTDDIRKIEKRKNDIIVNLLPDADQVTSQKLHLELDGLESQKREINEGRHLREEKFARTSERIRNREEVERKAKEEEMEHCYQQSKKDLMAFFKHLKVRNYDKK